jgi:hypothetical protein
MNPKRSAGEVDGWAVQYSTTPALLPPAPLHHKDTSFAPNSPARFSRMISAV